MEKIDEKSVYYSRDNRRDFYQPRGFVLYVQIVLILTC